MYAIIWDRKENVQAIVDETDDKLQIVTDNTIRIHKWMTTNSGLSATSHSTVQKSISLSEDAIERYNKHIISKRNQNIFQTKQNKYANLNGKNAVFGL